VVGVQDVGDVERAGGALGRHFAVHQVEEMGGFGEVLADRRELETLAETVERGDDDRRFGDDREADFGVFFEVRFADGGALVVDAEHRDTGAQDVHRAGVLRRGLEEVEHALRQGSVLAEALLEGLDFGLGRQVAAVEEEDDLFESAVVDQRVDRVAEVAEASLRSFHVAEG